MISLEGAPTPAKSAPKVEGAPKAAEPTAPTAPVAAAAPTAPAPPATPVPSQPPPPSSRVVAPPTVTPQAAKPQTATVKLPPTDPTKEISGTRTEYRVKMNRMRLRIAQRLKDAQNVNAMLTTFNEVDMR